MVTVSFVFDLHALYVVAATVLALLGYILYLKAKDRKVRAAMRRVTQAASRYLTDNLVDAHVAAYAVLGGRRFVVLVEAKPSERLRTSHVVETAIIDEVRKATGLAVERVFWRFPITALDKQEIRDDLYVAQGYAGLRNETGYTVAETPLEQFEDAVASLRSDSRT